MSDREKLSPGLIVGNLLTTSNIEMISRFNWEVAGFCFGHKSKRLFRFLEGKEPTRVPELGELPEFVDTIRRSFDWIPGANCYLKISGKTDFRARNESLSNVSIPEALCKKWIERLNQAFDKLRTNTDSMATLLVDETAHFNLGGRRESSITCQLSAQVSCLDLTSPEVCEILGKQPMSQQENIDSTRQTTPEQFRESIAAIRTRVPELVKSDFQSSYRISFFLYELQVQRTSDIAKFQTILDSCVGLEGDDMISVGKIVQEFCREFQCILVFRHDSPNPPTRDTCFTLKAGPIKSGRPDTLICSSLSQSLIKGERLARFPEFVAIPISELDAETKEAALTRWAASERGKRVSEQGLRILTKDELARAGRKGGKARSKKLTPEARREIALKAAHEKNRKNEK